MPKGKSSKLKKLRKRIAGAARVGGRFLKPIASAALKQFVPPAVLAEAKQGYKHARQAMKVFGDRSTSTRSSTSNPSSVSITRTNPTWSEVVGKVTSQFAGRSAAGIKIRGRQPCVAVYRPTSPGSAMVSDMATTSADGTANILPITPSALGGPLFVQASQYQMFVFRKMTFEYETMSSTTAEGQLALCYCREPLLASSGADNVPDSFGAARAITPSHVFPYRIEHTQFDVMYDGQQLFYTDATASADPEAARLAIQGQLRAYADQTVATSAYRGNIMLSYELDLFYPTVNAGVLFAARYLSGLQPSEYEEVARYVKRIKDDRKSAKQISGIILSTDMPGLAIAPVADEPVQTSSRSSSAIRKPL